MGKWLISYWLLVIGYWFFLTPDAGGEIFSQKLFTFHFSLFTKITGMAPC